MLAAILLVALSAGADDPLRPESVRFEAVDKGVVHGDTAPLHLDVLAAAHHLRRIGATRVFAIGGSIGGAAVARAALAEPGSLDRIVLLGATPDGPPEQLTVRKLYVMTRDDEGGGGKRLPGLQAHFARAPEPKELLVLDGSAHAQFMFQTPLADRVMGEIVRFLRAP